MSDIEFNCPHCKQSLAVEESGAGMAVPCPSCGQELTVPPPPSQFNIISGMIQLVCPGMCKHHFLVSQDMAGKLVWCPGCKKAIEVVGTGRFPEIKPTHEEAPKPTLGQVKKIVEFRSGKQQPASELSSGKCPSCGNAVQQDAVICVNCGLILKTGAKVQSAVAESPPIGLAGETKKCPFCAEEILAAAIKCKHCQSDLKTATSGGAEKAVKWMLGLDDSPEPAPAKGIKEGVKEGITEFKKGWGQAGEPVSQKKKVLWVQEKGGKWSLINVLCYVAGAILIATSHGLLKGCSSSSSSDSSSHSVSHSYAWGRGYSAGQTFGKSDRNLNQSDYMNPDSLQELAVLNISGNRNHFSPGTQEYGDFWEGYKQGYLQARY